MLAGRGVALDGVPRSSRRACATPARPVASARSRPRGRAPRGCGAGGGAIGLLGDYDVDGATSVALLARYLAAVGAPTAIDIPDRLREGYGPNAQALERLAAKGCRLVVTLDTGTTAFEPLARAAAQVQQIIVIDHHVAQAELPQALGVINPNRRDQISAVGELAAVGVTFLAVVALNRTLRARGHFVRRPEPDLRRWLDLVALGTICDVVPLVGLNRALVAQGLKVAARGANPGSPRCARRAHGLAAVRRALRLRVGAAAQCRRPYRMLASGGRAAHQRCPGRRDRDRAAAGAAERGAASARAPAGRGGGGADRAGAGAGRAAPVRVGEGWSPGVLGLVAARLTERYHRPSVAIGMADGVGKGSARSVAGFDLGGAVIAARQAGLLLQGGGHPMAAGLTVEAAKLPALEAFLAERVAGVPGLGRPAPRTWRSTARSRSRACRSSWPSAWPGSRRSGAATRSRASCCTQRVPPWSARWAGARRLPSVRPGGRRPGARGGVSRLGSAARARAPAGRRRAPAPCRHDQARLVAGPAAGDLLHRGRRDRLSAGSYSIFGGHARRASAPLILRRCCGKRTSRLIWFEVTPWPPPASTAASPPFSRPTSSAMRG